MDNAGNSYSFQDSILQIINAYDMYGVFQNLSDEQKLNRAFLLSADEKKQMDSCGQISERLKAQINIFFQAVALNVERKTNKMVSSIVEMNSEGFGRALIYSGNLIMVNKAIRGTQQLAFTNMERACKQGDKISELAVKTLDRYSHLTS
ncbi:hypothetical protein BKP37_01975 [Anaerobacillus alkalilacustris]|uniref:Uncharacterized protein n=1 Tax=Anaerobacillus alkalilacustris TaxID=393763 RepID=A0A1S2LY82_9BACI|nr:DUF269 domain-containing protein [Anaerobacillus alkalilacustris]OIJ17296.1 hypothetical protein BKP37_01975 [Anaerobacillus alkalilacustris]